MMHIASLHLYPVKSLRGFAVASAEVDENGRFLTQRTLPQMARIATALADGFLHLSAEGFGTAAVPTASDPSAPTLAVSVWSNDGMLAEDCSSEVSAWLSHVLDASCRLVRIGPAFHRPVMRGEARSGDVFSFADGAPLLVTATALLEELNCRILENGGCPVPMNRFRSNIVVKGSELFTEDGWVGLNIAGVRFRTNGPCVRCIMTTTDQSTGLRGKEPLKTLATFRRDPLDSPSVHFGVNLIQESKSGLLKVGDPVTVTCI